MGVKGAPLPPQPEQPASRNAAALNAKAEAAAAQPLPDSDDSDDDALGDVKGIMRTGVPKENGTTASKQSKVVSRTMSVRLLRAVIVSSCKCICCGAVCSDAVTDIHAALQGMA